MRKIINSEARGVMAGAAVIGVMASVIISGIHGCNRFNNNRVEKNQGYELYSRTVGISGHEEFVRYKDGSQEVKTYSGIGHRVFSSKLYRDLEGNNLVDQIRVQGGEIKMNKLTKLLIRELDYTTHKGEFNEADNKLLELKKRYDLESRSIK